MATKRNVFKSQLPLIIVAATMMLSAVIYFLCPTVSPSRCDRIFEETADPLKGNVKLIKIKVEPALDRVKLQEFIEASQEVALHLKSWCITQEAIALNAGAISSLHDAYGHDGHWYTGTTGNH